MPTTCIVPYNGEKYRVDVRISGSIVYVRHPVAGWMDLNVLEERLRRKLYGFEGADLTKIRQLRDSSSKID